MHTPTSSRTPRRQYDTQGTVGSSAFSQITNAIFDTLKLTSKASSSRSLNSKIHADSHTSSSRRSKRTSGRTRDSDLATVRADNHMSTSRRSMRRTSVHNGDSELAMDSSWARRISVRDRSSGRTHTDGAAIDLATAAMIASNLHIASHRPVTLVSTKTDGFSNSIRNLRAMILGNGPDIDMNRRQDSKALENDYADGLYKNNDDAFYMDDEDDFDDEDDEDPETRRMQMLLAAEQDELAYFSQRGGASDQFQINRRWVLHPYGRARSAWDLFLLSLVTWMLLTTPFELSFRELSFTTRRVILSLDYFLDTMFAIDIVLNFLTGVEFDGRLHFSYQTIRRQYVYGWLVMDVLWTIPFYAFTHTTGATIPDFMSIQDLFQSNLYPLLRVFRLARILSLARIRRRLEFSLRLSSSSSSLGGFVYSVLALSHLFSCMFAYLAFGDPDHLAIALADRTLEDDSIYTKYIASSYWAMMTIATVGYGDVTVRTNAGRMFAIVAMVIGGGIFAYGISNVVDLIQQLYSEETEYRHKMDRVNTFMHDRALPRKLRDEIRANFFHLHKAARENKREDHTIVQQMSRTMQSHIADHFCRSMMPKRMPTLAGCNAEFIHELYLAMEVQCYLPGENIVRQDDIGSEIYFLMVGHVQVFVGHTKIALFGPNTCFGEFTILNPKRPKLATIQAVDFCETHCITRSQLFDIVLKHPFVMRSTFQLVQLKHRKVLAVLTDQTIKTRTLIQCLAGVWHADGLQALLPPGASIEDYPELESFDVRQTSSATHTTSGRMGIISPIRRKSIEIAESIPNSSNFANGWTSSDSASTTAVPLSPTETLVLRKSSVRMQEPSLGESVPGVPSSNKKRMQQKGPDQYPEAYSRTSSMGGDNRIELALHQMNVLMKRQERIEQQLQQLIDTRQRTASVPATLLSSSTSSASTDFLHNRTLVTDFSKSTMEESLL